MTALCRIDTAHQARVWRLPTTAVLIGMVDDAVHSFANSTVRWSSASYYVGTELFDIQWLCRQSEGVCLHPNHKSLANNTSFGHKRRSSLCQYPAPWAVPVAFPAGREVLAKSNILSRVPDPVQNEWEAGIESRTDVPPPRQSTVDRRRAGGTPSFST